MVWIGSKQRVHGAERDGVCPKAGSLAGKRDDAGGIADAAIAGAAQAVDLHREPPQALLWCDVRNRVATRRRDRRRDALGCELDDVIARRLDAGQPRATWRAAHRKVRIRAVLVSEPHPIRDFSRGRHFERLPCRCRDQRRQPRGLQLAAALRQVCGRVAGKLQCRENAAEIFV